MGGAAEHLGHPGIQKRVGRVDDGAAGEYLIIEGEGALPAHVADDVEGFGPVVVGGAAFLDNGHGHAQTLRHVPRPLADAEIDGNQDQVLQPLLGEVVGQDRFRGQLVHRDAEEALDLTGVKVQCEHPVGAGGGDQIGHQASGNGYAGLVLLIGSAIAVVRHHRGDATRRCPLAGVDHDQQFHQVVVGGRHRGLHDEHVPLPDVLADADEGVVVGELEGLALPQWDPQVVADIPRQLGMRVPGEYLEFFERGHGSTLQ